MVDRLSRRVAARDPRLVLGQSRMRISARDRTLTERIQAKLHGDRARLLALIASLDGLSPLGVLGRGYAIATRLDGRVIRGPADVALGELFRLRLGLGEIIAACREKAGDDPNAVDVDALGIDHELK
jgi:exodeoxyribonuclease VII large subunit